MNAYISSSDAWTDITPNDNMTFGERIQVQEFLLDEMEILLDRVSGMTNFVIDKTPIDVLAYLLANIDGTTSSIFDSRGQAFINRCISLTAKNFTHYVVIPPGIPPASDIGRMGKVFNSIMYQESITDVIIGAYYRYFETLRSSGSKTLILVPDSITDLTARISFIVTSIKAVQ